LENVAASFLELCLYLQEVRSFHWRQGRQACRAIRFLARQACCAFRFLEKCFESGLDECCHFKLNAPFGYGLGRLIDISAIAFCQHYSQGCVKIYIRRQARYVFSGSAKNALAQERIAPEIFKISGAGE
jgi:hypothetical protein